MFKKLIIFFLLAGLNASIPAYAVMANDTGKVINLYVDSAGSVAIWLSNGYPNAKASGTCPTSNGWAGVSGNQTVIINSLITAKASQDTVVVYVEGCEAQGYWYKISSVNTQ